VTHAASLGIGSVHEMAGPDVMGLEDFDAWLEGTWPIDVVGYWGDLDLDIPLARHLRQVGGALHLDGSIGSHTAALVDEYAVFTHPTRGPAHGPDRAAALAGRLPTRWERTDEWYDFATNPRGRVRVLATVDESTHTGGRNELIRHLQLLS
jgi:predicted amidohydrolase YtcJ